MVLTHPDFTVVRPPGLSTWITDALWWFWLRLQELEPTSELGGIAASKRGFHSSGQYNLDNYPNDYSIRDAVNRQGPLWKTKSSALDWTFPEAHQKNYARIAKYMQRLLVSARDPNDPRLDVLYEFFGQADSDSDVEGWNEFRDAAASSDPSHLFHVHFSLLRLFCGDFWAMWGVLTVLMGWPVAQWRASLSPLEEDVDAVQNDHLVALAYRTHAGVVAGSPTVQGGPTAGEPVWLTGQVKAISQAVTVIQGTVQTLAAAVAQLEARPPVAPTPIDVPTLVAALQHPDVAAVLVAAAQAGAEAAEDS